MKEVNSKFVERFRELRSKDTEPLINLAAALSVHISSVYYWLQGKRNPKFCIVKRIADYYNVSVNWLLGNDGAEELTYEVTEVCAECGRENTLTWDVGEDGYRVFCPNCGNEMMLCDACKHAPDNEAGYCDGKADFNGEWTCWRKSAGD